MCAIILEFLADTLITRASRTSSAIWKSSWVRQELISIADWSTVAELSRAAFTSSYIWIGLSGDSSMRTMSGGGNAATSGVAGGIAKDILDSYLLRTLSSVIRYIQFSSIAFSGSLPSSSSCGTCPGCFFHQWVAQLAFSDFPQFAHTFVRWGMTLN